MAPFLFGLFTWFGTFFRSRYNLSLEIIALRQQLGVLKRKTPRPRPKKRDRMFWILLRRIWPLWSNALIVVKPETVVSLSPSLVSFQAAAQAPGHVSAQSSRRHHG
jgi:hypothetical protein